MRLLFWPVLLALTINSGVVAFAQKAPPTSVRKAAPWKQYCQPDGGFCFKYPNAWSVMGEVFDGHGVVVAPPQQQDRALWDAVTAGLIVLPPRNDEDPVSVDQIIEQTMTSLREEGQNVETLQRQERRIDANPAQMLKVRYHDKSVNRDWIEQLVFIVGPQGEIYSVALKCSPQSLPRLEPILTTMLQSWKLPQPERPAEEPAAAPKH